MDERTPGFGIRVNKTRKTWLATNSLTRAKEAIGHYPSTSLSEARRRAQAMLLSPTGNKPTVPTFTEAVEAFLSLPRWKHHSLRVLKSSLKHFTWKRPLDKITHEDVAQALEAIEAPSARAHALKDIRTFFNWCIPRHLSASPCQGLKMAPQPSRARVLSDHELKAVWNACDGIFGVIVKLLILTGQRRTEIASLTSEMIEEDRITLPVTLTKNGREHSFPRTSQVKHFTTKKVYCSRLQRAWTVQYVPCLASQCAKPTSTSVQVLLAGRSMISDARSQRTVQGSAYPSTLPRKS